MKSNNYKKHLLDLLEITYEKTIEIHDTIELKSLIELVRNNKPLPDNITLVKDNNTLDTNEEVEISDPSKIIEIDEYEKKYNQLPNHILRRIITSASTGEKKTKYYDISKHTTKSDELKFVKTELVDDEDIKLQLLISQADSQKRISFTLSYFMWLSIISISLSILYVIYLVTSIM